MSSKYYKEHKEECNLKGHLYYETHKLEHKIRGKQYQEEHKAEIKTQRKLYYEANKEVIKANARSYKNSHKKERSEYTKEYYETHKEDAKQYAQDNKEKISKRHSVYIVEYMKDPNHQESNKISGKKSRYQIKIDVLTHYGNGNCVCVKCGFDDIRALAIDHIKGDGHLEKRNGHRITGTKIYSKLKREGYPEGYQTLCACCNKIKVFENKELPIKHDGIYPSFMGNLKDKIVALTHYGEGYCGCVRCGFNDIRALSIDHINGDGHEHRKVVTNLYSWLRLNSYPDNFQTLCYNCQEIKRYENNELNDKCKTKVVDPIRESV